MTEEIINTDDYFYEITDESRGTIGYGCVSYKTAELVRRIHKQNKQLQPLKQENKELKEKVIELSEEKGHLIVENNTLKEFNQSLSMLGTDLISVNETIRKEFFRADKNKDMWREKAENYRLALEEIREVLKPYLTECQGFLCEPIDEVLNKINEVIGES